MNIGRIFAIGIVSCFAVLILRFGEASACLPETYVHTSTVAAGDLEVSIATEKTDYVLGEAVSISLSIHNPGIESVEVAGGVTPFESINIFPATCKGPTTLDCYVASFPGAVIFFGQTFTVEPGGCLTRFVIWDGLTIDAETLETTLPPPADYVLEGGFNLVSGFFPENGIQLEIAVVDTNAVVVQPMSWGAIKSEPN